MASPALRPAQQQPTRRLSDRLSRRPALLINGIDDPIFPIAGAREGFAKLKEVYGVLGVADHVDADFFDGGHSWSNNKTIPFLKKQFGE
ncbi:hypothetical protein [Blastopirellula retiformator]|uniref:hypothetical protein n=1 Tax=Blastopirellula retiformator TaxID=2527970 RepID=UPI001645810F|nr:hypothetical protein [Blastopirellula retiformator]